MTPYEAFLDKLRATPRDWKLTTASRTAIRRGEGPDQQCPLTACINLPYGKAWKAIASFGFGPGTDQGWDIIEAADGSYVGHVLTPKTQAIRRDLLEATGLLEAVEAEKLLKKLASEEDADEHW